MATTTAGIAWTTMGIIHCKERPPREPLRYDRKAGAYSLTRRWYVECTYELLAGLLTSTTLEHLDILAPDTIPRTMILPYDPHYNLPVTLRRCSYRIFWYGANPKCEVEVEYKGHEIAFCNGSYEWDGVISFDWEPSLISERRIFSLDLDGDGMPTAIGADSEGVNAKSGEQT